MSTGTSGSTGRTVRYAVGVVLLVVGIGCVIWGFSTFTGSALDGSGDGAGRSMALFGGGGFAAVVGFGLVAFTRVGALSGRGGYTRVTYEQGYGAAGAPSPGAAPGGASHCRSCGAAVAAEDRFCGACGSPLQRAAGLA